MTDSPQTVVVPLLPGFEEIEAVTIIDVLRRAELKVLVASTRIGPVRGSHDIEIAADTVLADVVADQVDMIALPGGMPGAANLARDAEVQRLIHQLAEAGKFTCAVCAAPIALAAAGVHRGKRITSYPGFEPQLEGGTLVQDRVVIDGTVVTSRGPGTVMEFALTLVGLLRGQTAQADVARRMLVAAKV
jgi:4-methyl-5(b-hydroxyethyl)-thiazole monophosphate biosynthesis